MERIPIKDSPKLMEAVVQEIQVALGDAETGLPWLDHVFGKSETTRCDYNGRWNYKVPSVYVGGGKYERITPDRRDLGNYAFFYIHGVEDVLSQGRTMPYFRMGGKVSLVVWGDIRTMESQDDRNIESVKNEILQVLGGIQLKSGRVIWRSVYDEGVDVWEHYSCGEEEGQMMMWPYFAFRFRGDVECDTGCVRPSA